MPRLTRNSLSTPAHPVLTQESLGFNWCYTTRTNTGDSLVIWYLWKLQYAFVMKFKATSLYTVQVTCSVRGWEKGYRKVSGQALGYAFVNIWTGSRSSLATLWSRIDSPDLIPFNLQYFKLVAHFCCICRIYRFASHICLPAPLPTLKWSVPDSDPLNVDRSVLGCRSCRSLLVSGNLCISCSICWQDICDILMALMEPDRSPSDFRTVKWRLLPTLHGAQNNRLVELNV